MYPRAKVFGLIIQDGKLLLEEYGEEPAKGSGYFYRPLGGSIEFGERSDEALVREFREELGYEVLIDEYVTCLENIFWVEEEMGHEIIQVYLVSFQDDEAAGKSEYGIIDKPGGRAVWVRIDECVSGDKVLYPEGLAEVLKGM
ncbi:NUDIX hydrolase [Jeotgalibacillus sp. R-1-5s-1]|uniref:NUDIX hydrolase n=1 Tax=Jeotgalibacillus sp. R-1-5s-1 TaxID=2555897 RepID=UPI00106B9618|nr:NUDIX domain-containing protein [Jeotgalibacillus sp. R-1-5s-1]TFD94466.1 NUDIX domain-containing protein [Jeotgalibacillus sp. R-1-5s-1]